MIKLYKNIKGELHYGEAWKNDDNTATVHWGIGDNKKIGSGLLSNFRKIVQKEINKKIKDEYSEFSEDEQSFLEIEFKIEGFGSEKELEKGHRLEEKLDQLLG